MNITAIIGALAALAAASAACGDSGTHEATGASGGAAGAGAAAASRSAAIGAGAGGGTADGGRGISDGSAGSAGLVDTGPIDLPACEAMDSVCDGPAGDTPSCGQCQYRLLYDTAHCSKDSPCDNLVLYFAAFDCTTPNAIEMFEGIVEAYPDFVAACVQPNLPGEVLPSSLGAPQRDSATLEAVFDELKTKRGVWTGRNVLMGGCSAGASRYPTVAARYADESQWMGTAKTAVCMSDGVIDIPYQDRFIGEGTGESCASRHGRVARGYTTTSPGEGHSCSGTPSKGCACDPNHLHRTYPNSCGGGDCVEFDSVVKESGAGWAFNTGVTAASFAVPHWKLISEGSAATLANRCEMDICPEEPFKAFCDLLDADPLHDCVHVSRPDAKHCQYYNTNFASECVDWFKGL